MLNVVMLNVIMLYVIVMCVNYAECRGALERAAAFLTSEQESKSAMILGVPRHSA